MLWEPERDTKPDYSSIEMDRFGVPKNYKEKNDRRAERQKKKDTKKIHAEINEEGKEEEKM